MRTQREEYFHGRRYGEEPSARRIHQPTEWTAWSIGKPEWPIRAARPNGSARPATERATWTEEERPRRGRRREQPAAPRFVVSNPIKRSRGPGKCRDLFFGAAIVAPVGTVILSVMPQSRQNLLISFRM